MPSKFVQFNCCGWFAFNHTDDPSPVRLARPTLVLKTILNLQTYDVHCIFYSTSFYVDLQSSLIASFHLGEHTNHSFNTDSCFSSFYFYWCFWLYNCKQWNCVSSSQAASELGQNERSLTTVGRSQRTNQNRHTTTQLLKYRLELRGTLSIQKY